MNSGFEAVQKDFRDECDRIGRCPNLVDYVTRIRAAFPVNIPIYVVIHEYHLSSGSDRDAELLTEADINWPGQKNEKIWRNIYFHPSSQNPNIWILRDRFRGDKNILSAILSASGQKKFVYLR